MSLPGPNVFENYTSVTIEVWVTTVASKQFTRLFQFGELNGQQYSVKVNTGYYCKGWTIKYSLAMDGFQNNQSIAKSCDQTNQHIVVTMPPLGR